MGIEALKQQLAEGKLSKEQFLAELKKLLDAGSISQEEHDAAAKEAEGDDKKDDKPLTADQVAAMIAEAVKKAEQSAGDKVRTEYAAKLKKEQEEKDRLLKEKMSDEEKAKFEKEKLEKDLAEREAAIIAREVELHTIDKLTEAKLPLSFKPFLVAADKEGADRNVTAFAAEWQKAIKEAVDAKFKDNGGDPTKRKGGGGAKRWKELTLTEQGKMYAEDKEAARLLAAADGVKLP